MGEYGSSVPTDRRLQEALLKLRKCEEIAKKFNTEASQAVLNTPKNRNTVAAARLLLKDISEVTADNDILPPTLQFLFDIGKKSSKLEAKTQPHKDLYLNIANEIYGGAKAILEFSRTNP
jgi:hypothetical protein